MRILKVCFVENNLKSLNFLQKLKLNFSKLLNLGLGSGTGFLKNFDSGTGSGFENFPNNRVLGSGSKPGTGSFASLFMRKGLKRKTYQNLPSLTCVEICPYEGSNHRRHHDLKECAFSTETKFVAFKYIEL